MGDFRMEMTDDKKVITLFQELPKAAQNRVLKPLIREGGKMIAAEEKEEAPAVTGLMKLAIGASPLRTYPSSLLVAVGVRRGFRRAVQGTQTGRTRYLGKQKTEASPELPVQNPTKYLHLVTGGRKAISVVNKKVLFDVRTGKFFGKTVAEQAANPFVDRAYDRAKIAVAETITSQANDKVLAEAQAILGKG